MNFSNFLGISLEDSSSKISKLYGSPDDHGEVIKESEIVVKYLIYNIGIASYFTFSLDPHHNNVVSASISMNLNLISLPSIIDFFGKKNVRDSKLSFLGKQKHELHESLLKMNYPENEVIMEGPEDILFRDDKALIRFVCYENDNFHCSEIDLSLA